jgi:hypothetical protein
MKVSRKRPKQIEFRFISVRTETKNHGRVRVQFHFHVKSMSMPASMSTSMSTPTSMSMFASMSLSMSRPRPRPCPLHKTVLIFRFGLFRNTEKLLLFFFCFGKRPKQIEFRFEPKQKIVCFEDTLLFTAISNVTKSLLL